MKFLEMIQPLEISSGPEPAWDWDKPSKGVIVIGQCHGVVILHGAGPFFSDYASEVSYSAIDLGLEFNEDEGVYVWEGVLRCIEYNTQDGREYDQEAIGELREPTEEEWECIRNGVCPWNDRDWLRNPCEIPDCSYPAEGGYPVCEDHRKEVEGEDPLQEESRKR